MTSRSVAQSLFDDARRMMAAGNFAGACLKLAESQKLEPVVGTLLNLADCHEHEGRLATAYHEFNEAGALAARSGQAARVQLAKDRMARLEARLPKLRVVVSQGAAVDGMQIELDETALPAPAWGVAAPADPGKHKLRVTAPDRVPYEVLFEVPSEPGTHHLHVPALAVAERAPAPAPRSVGADKPSVLAAPAAVHSPDVRPGGGRPLGWAMLGTSAVALGVAAYFGVRAFTAHAEAEGRCARGGCDSRALELIDTKDDAALVSSIASGVGAAALVVGMVVLLKPADASRAARSTVRPTASIGAEGARIGAVVRW